MFFLEFDLSAAELWVLAHEAGEEKMIEVLTSGRDPHVATANYMFGTPEEIIEKESELLGSTTDSSEIQFVRENQIPEIFEHSEFPPIGTMTLRQSGKKSNYGLGYGMEADKFSLENLIPIEDSKLLVNLYRKRAYPGLLRYYDEIQTQLKNNDRTLENCFGRKIKLLSAWGPSLFNQGYSFKPQSTVADIVVQAMCEFWESDNDTLKPAILAQQVHDSLGFAFPENLVNLAPSFIQTTQTLLCPTLTIKNRSFTIPVDCKIGLDFGNMTKLDLKRTIPTTAEIQNKLRRIEHADQELRAES